MVAWSVLGEHGFALLLLWGCVGLTGLIVLSWLRLGIGLASAPLAGVIFWSVALFLLPFAGGIDLAAALLILLGMIALVRRWREGSAFWKRWPLASWILILGSLPYTTTLVFHYVPFGMDATMHATAATLIARAHGLPGDYSPFMPGVPFSAVNLGVPAVAALAIRWGGEPAAVMLAMHHLTFTCLILATYVLLRWWTAATSAAVLAVASVWMARASQATLGWGGFPTIMSVAVGVLAGRLLLQHATRSNWRLSLASGAAIAALPLIHGIGAGTWIYCAGIWAGVAAVLNTTRLRFTLRGLLLTCVWSGVFLAAYRMSGSLSVQGPEMEETKRFVQMNAPPEEDWRAWTTSLLYVRKDSGSVIVLAGWSACALLLLRREWRAALLLTAAWLSLITVVANARWYVLPASFLLYPDRALYWTGPLSAVGLALAWRSFPLRGLVRLPMFVAVGVLVLAGYYQNNFYQKMVRDEFVTGDGWEALVWAKQHLHPQRHFVRAEVNTAASFLPAVAQIGCNGSHHHHFIARHVQRFYDRRACTHEFLMTPGSLDRLPGNVVFRNRTVAVVELPQRSSQY